MKKDTLPEIRRKQINRRLAIVHDALLPKSTLQSVGKNWGISRERVRKIFLNVTGKPFPVVRKGLIKNNTKFLCPICGEPMDPRSSRIYCSRACYGVTTRYDLENPTTCRYCGREFFPYRNWKSFSKYKKCLAGRYCCVKHYILHRSRKGKKGFSEHSIIIEKLNRLGGGE